MCGIFCSIALNGSCKKQSVDGIENATKILLERRGPDLANVITADNAIFGGFVLWQQGLEVCEQPAEFENIILLLNGDAFKIDDNKTHDLADTARLACALSKCNNDQDICAFLRTIEGPFSLIFYNKATHNLYFCRDIYGRNSLLIGITDGNQLRILSTAYNDTSCTQIMELPPLGLYKLNTMTPDNCTVYPWSATCNEEWHKQAESFTETLQMKLIIEDAINADWLSLAQSDVSFDFYNLCRNLVNTPTDELFPQLLTNNELLKEIDIFLALLRNSVQQRTQTTPKFCKDCLTQRQACEHSKIAILFSGGIDCSILAILTDLYVPKNDAIDLINVAFESIKTTTTSTTNWDVPDRCSAKASFMELQKICPARKWNFIEVNVTRAELESELKKQIKHLIYPLHTVLDESIGCAFWFAARGVGICNDVPYESTARVIIVGSGADELFGGYTRHRNAYKRCVGNEMTKLANLHIELEKDWSRLPSRNLARDDRVIADNAKTARSPFIEENVVRYVRSLKPNQRCCFLLAEGIGDKLFLRLCGYRLGLKGAVSLRKRAIQFGSKIANHKQNANDQSHYLKYTIKTQS